MIDRLRALYHTPIRDEQRIPLFIAATLVLILAGVGFSLAAGGDRDASPEAQQAAPPPATPEPEPVPAPTQDEDLADIPVPSEEEPVDEEDAPTEKQIAAAKANAEDFLERYLAWTYGRGTTRDLAEGATDDLLEQLGANRPRPPRDADDRDAEIQTLTLEGASNRAMNMLAVIDDTKSVYTVSLTTARDSDDEWIVTEVGP